MDRSELTDLELERYTRHVRLPHMGYEGQQRLKRASVVVVGVGGLGCVSALYLTLAGVGRIGLVEDDQVSLHNLHRQILYNSDDLEEDKLGLAVNRLKQHNPEVEFTPHHRRLTQGNAREIIRDYDLVIDGTDNLETRHVINRACVDLDKAFVYGAVNLFDGQVSVFHASQGPCLACVFPIIPPFEKEKSPERLAVLNTLPAVVGALQAAEGIKLITGLGKPMIGKLLIYNALNTAFEQVEIQKNSACPVCGS
ncbi:MAG: HesA/MoeB/ThiF family protein [Brevefilum sp.]|nr:HesA/MoeB/ThiF family protein [Brevefilum sp.]